MRATAHRGSRGATRSRPSGLAALVCHRPSGTRVSDVSDVAAPTYDSEKQLGWEARHRPRAGIAAVVGAIGLFLYFALEQVVLRGIPDTSGLAALGRVAQPGNVADLPSLRVPYFEYLYD